MRRGGVTTEPDGTRPASLVSPFGQPRDSRHRKTADRYAPQIRIVKGDVPVTPVASVPAGQALQPEPVVTQGLGALHVALRLGDHADAVQRAHRPAVGTQITSTLASL